MALSIFLLVFVSGYPTKKQFDGIGTAIVKFLKLSVTNENILSSFDI